MIAPRAARQRLDALVAEALLTKNTVRASFGGNPLAVQPLRAWTEGTADRVIFLWDRVEVTRRFALQLIEEFGR
jgi:hypothetical protein